MGAVSSELVSSDFPVKQGKNREFSRKWAEFGPMTGGNPLETGGFPVNSLQNITGKFKTRTGTLMRGTGNLKLRTVSDGVDAPSRRHHDVPGWRYLMSVPGIGPIGAMAIQAFAPPMESFRRGRDFSAWLVRTIPAAMTGVNHGKATPRRCRISRPRPIKHDRPYTPTAARQQGYLGDDPSPGGATNHRTRPHHIVAVHEHLGLHLLIHVVCRYPRAG